MNPEASFNVEFDYALSEKIILQLTASVQLHHSVPHYQVTDFHFTKNTFSKPFLPDIYIMAVKDKNGIRWVHTDSRKETILSMAVGKAIERTGSFEISEPG